MLADPIRGSFCEAFSSIDDFFPFANEWLLYNVWGFPTGVTLRLTREPTGDEMVRVVGCFLRNHIVPWEVKRIGRLFTLYYKPWQLWGWEALIPHAIRVAFVVAWQVIRKKIFRKKDYFGW